MSLAFSLFGAPNYPTEEVYDDSCDVLPAQYASVPQVHNKNDRHWSRLDDSLIWRSEECVNSSDGTTHKRPWAEATLSPKMASSSLVPMQPASPPPAHMLSASVYANTKLALTMDPVGPECPMRAEKILRWCSYAIRYGFPQLHIEVVDGWAHIHELAKAASTVRKDFSGLTPSALRSIIQHDESGRWRLLGSSVRIIPRSSRCGDSPLMLRNEAQDTLPLCDYIPTGSPPAKKSFAKTVAECHLALAECVFYYSLLEKSFCIASEDQ